jgi:hypothetical protein
MVVVKMLHQQLARQPPGVARAATGLQLLLVVVPNQSLSSQWDCSTEINQSRKRMDGVEPVLDGESEGKK